ncbi:hypothetical protein ACFLYE_01395 [Chloroflexota bacterium]
MKIHQLSLTKPNFSWVAGDQQEQERLICEAFLKIQIPGYDGNVTFERPKVDPPDVIIKLSNGKTLAAEVTEYVPYERRTHAQANSLLNALRKILAEWKVCPSTPCNVVLGFKPELKSSISQRRLLNEAEQIALKVKEFFETNDISNEKRVLKIFEGDVSVTFIPALGNFRTHPGNYNNNLYVACWDGILLEREPNDIKEIISHKDEKLRKALSEKGEQCRTDVLIIWTTIPIVEELFDINMEEPSISEYSGIYYLFINNVIGKEEGYYIAGVETIRESSKERSFFA